MPLTGPQEQIGERSADSLRPAALELAVVIPTYNEIGNISPLLHRLETVLEGIEWEVIFVDDDSPDGTAEAIRQIGARHPRVRVMQRIGRRGLASACIEGMLGTSAAYIAVMDADLQHDESILPRMLERIQQQHLDVVIASRNIENGSMGHFAESRVRLSRLGARLSQVVSHCNLSDPMSGFFVVDRRFLSEVVHSLSGVGFKILLDLVASCRRPVRFSEVPYSFGTRQHGDSKLDISVGLEYINLLLDKLVGHIVPPRFILYTAVGTIGLVLHLAILGVLYRFTHTAFNTAQATATYVAMILNFLLNNLVTFRDRRLRGMRLVRGLVIFVAACSIGAVTNFSVAQFTLNAGLPWYLAGMLGMGISSVWNYGVNTIFTWRRNQQSARSRRSAAPAASEALAARP